MDDIDQKFAHIKGWGVDADPKNEPTYPIKLYTGADHNRMTWERPLQQPTHRMEILHSNERPHLTAVFGTSVPPSGLSGMIRRSAFKHSENSYLHWLPLLIADRVNVAEGVVDDLLKGHVPNLFAERGWKAKWKHNPRGLILKVAGVAAVTAALVVVAVRRNER